MVNGIGAPGVDEVPITAMPLTVRFVPTEVVGTYIKALGCSIISNSEVCAYGSSGAYTETLPYGSSSAYIKGLSGSIISNGEVCTYGSSSSNRKS